MVTSSHTSFICSTSGSWREAVIISRSELCAVSASAEASESLMAPTKRSTSPPGARSVGVDEDVDGVEEEDEEDAEVEAESSGDGGGS